MTVPSVTEIRLARSRYEQGVRDLALQMLDDDPEVYSRELWERSDKHINVASVGRVLKGLEARGTLKSRLQNPKIGARGGQRRYFSLVSRNRCGGCRRMWEEGMIARCKHCDWARPERVPSDDPPAELMAKIGG